MKSSNGAYKQMQKKLVTARTEFMRQLTSFTTEELQMQPEKNEWSALQVALHISIVDRLALDEMKRVQQEENPLIESLHNIAPRLTNEAEIPASLDAVLLPMEARRNEVFTFLEQLPEQSWTKSCRYENLGQLTFSEFVYGLVQHDNLHMGQLIKISQILRES